MCLRIREVKFEDIINADPTLKAMLRDYTFDVNKLDHQVRISCNCIMIAFTRYLDKKYR